jgi:hypothetical protein
MYAEYRHLQWRPGKLRPFGPLEMSPAAGVLNYGQGLFEGMKAYRTVANRIVLFRPDQVRHCSPPATVHLISHTALFTLRMRHVTLRVLCV